MSILIALLALLIGIAGASLSLYGLWKRYNEWYLIAGMTLSGFSVIVAAMILKPPIEALAAQLQVQRLGLPPPSFSSLLGAIPPQVVAPSAMPPSLTTVAPSQPLENYISDIKVLRFEVAKGDRFGRSVPGIFGAIKNVGTKTIGDVRAVVYFYDPSNKIIHEEEYPLVSSSGFDDDGPLRPNYEREFGYSVEDVAPQNWNGYCQLAITEVKSAN